MERSSKGRVLVMEWAKEHGYHEVDLYRVAEGRLWARPEEWSGPPGPVSCPGLGERLFDSGG